MIKELPPNVFEHFDDVSCEYRCGPVLRRRQLGKKLIGTTKAGWATIVFQFQDFVRGQWATPRTSVQRWRKVDGYWRCIKKIHFRHGRALEALEAAAAFEDGWESRAAAADLALAEELPSRRRRASSKRPAESTAGSL
jgi:hypothetical protein